MTDADTSTRSFSDAELAVPAAGVLAAVGVVGWSFLAPPPAGVTREAQAAFAVFAFALVLWLTEAVPYVVSATLAVVLLYVLGAAETFQAAASGFASRLVFFLLLVLVLGRAISRVELDAWLATRLLSTGVRSSRPVQLVATSILASAFVMPSAVARAVTFIPIVRELAGTYGFDRGGGFDRSAFLVLGHVNPIASMALMTGGGMALVTSAVVRSEVRPVSWLAWAVLMVPPVLVLYTLAALTAERITGAGATTVDDADALDATDLNGGALAADQRYVAAVLVGTVCLWTVGSFVSLPTIVPAALAVAALSLPGPGVLDSEAVESVNWGIVFVVGAMFSILDSMTRTGALAALVDAATGAIPLAAFSRVEGVAVLLALAVLVRVFFSTASAAIVVVLPVVLRLGDVVGANPLFLSLSVLLVVGSTTVFPFNTTSVLVSFDRGPLSNRDVATFGLVTTAYAVVVAALSWALYWPLVA